MGRVASLVVAGCALCVKRRLLSSVRSLVQRKTLGLLSPKAMVRSHFIGDACRLVVAEALFQASLIETLVALKLLLELTIARNCDGVDDVGGGLLTAIDILDAL